MQFGSQLSEIFRLDFGLNHEPKPQRWDICFTGSRVSDSIRCAP